MYKTIYTEVEDDEPGIVVGYNFNSP